MILELYDDVQRAIEKELEGIPEDPEMEYVESMSAQILATVMSVAMIADTAAVSQSERRIINLGVGSWAAAAGAALTVSAAGGDGRDVRAAMQAIRNRLLTNWNHLLDEWLFEPADCVEVATQRGDS